MIHLKAKRPHAVVQYNSSDDLERNYKAEIPEILGRRVITISAYDRSDISPGVVKARFDISDLTINKSPKHLRSTLWGMVDVRPGTERERLEEIVNEYYNHRSLLKRAFRVHHRNRKEQVTYPK